MSSEHPRNGASLRRNLLRAFGLPFLVTIAVFCAGILIMQVVLGSKSPGIVKLGLINLRFMPLYALIFFVFPSVCAIVLIRRVSRKARVHGMTWYQYLDLSPEERNRLNAAAIDEKN